MEEKMLLFYLFSLLLCVYETQQDQHYYEKKYRSKKNAKESYRRVVQLMRSYYEEAHSRITYMNPMRFMYEESPYYEMGYITGEIIERYRKVIEHAQRPHRFKSMTVFDILKRVEFVQKLYFELYHLVRMIHETPRKWVSVLEFINIERTAGPDVVSGLSLGKGKDNLSELSLAELFEKQRMLDDRKIQQQRQKESLMREYAKMRKAYLESLGKINMTKTKKYNTQWPIDYGWEIDYTW